MNELANLLAGWTAGAAGALLAAAWQGALLAGVVWLVLRLLPGLSAAARSVVWLSVFVLIFLLPLVPLFVGGDAAGSAFTAHAIRLDPRWSLLLGGAWLVCSLVRAGQLAAGAIHLRRLGRRAQPMAVAPEIAPLLEHNGRLVELCASPEVARPSVLGFFRPKILIPPGLLERLTMAELYQVVLHEMEHLRRGDDWTNLLQKLALVVFPLNPALAWVERRLCAERELACDDRVLDSGPGRKAYALCLARLAEYALVRRGFGLVLGAWERRPELVRRVQRILGKPIRGMGRKPALAATGGLVAGALACALALARAPQVVRFAPAPMTRAQIAASLDVGQVSQALGRRPEMLKAELSAAHEVPAAAQEQSNAKKVEAFARRTAHRAAPASRLADLRIPPPLQPADTLLVVTGWTDLDAPPQMVLAFARLPRVTQAAQPGMAVHATYAVVRTPAGWLVIQI